jgi:tetrahydromethanopterin S-methyltransferase subunit C
MKSGMWNLGFGLLGVIAGASGQFTLPGTTSPTWLIVVGAVVAGFGLIQLIRSRGQ